MNKILKVLAASALVATGLVGCSKSGDTTAAIAKAGLGVVSSYDEGEITTTFVGLGLDADGKIAYIDLDVALSTPGTDAEYDLTKEERGDDYGMKSTSANIGNIEGGAEWYEQAEAFETFCKDKTVDEVVAAMDDTGYAAEGTDLAAGCTISISSFVEALQKASDNAVDVNADSVVLGRTMSNDADAQELDTTMVLLALDTDKKVVYAKVDVAQIYEDEEGNVITDTKSERGDDYGMKSTSASIGNIEGGAEWYEQAAAFEDYCVGKTQDEIAATEMENGTATDADLLAGCTIHISDFVTAVSKAK